MDATRGYLTAVCAIAACLVTAAPAASAATYPAGFEEQVIARDLDQPTMVAWTPDGRMLVAEKRGRLQVFAPGASKPNASPAIDITKKVNSGGDRGLLGLAVDPAFATNHYVYLLYTYEPGWSSLQEAQTDSDTQPAVSQLLRVTLSDSGQAGAAKVLLGTVADTLTAADDRCPTAANTVDCIPSERDSHSIGTVRAAPDGTLFVGSGDGSDYGEADRQALGTYDETSLRGKILHVDRDGRGLAGHAFCPGDADLTHVCTKLYAKGFRNPFRFTLMPDGRLAVADVGWNTTEELDIVSSGGGDYGWPCWEGPRKTPVYQGYAECQNQEYPKESSPATATRKPVYSYDHPTGNAILAGPVYTGDEYPAGYRNDLFFGDFVGGFVKRLDPSNLASPIDFAGDWSSVALEAAPNGDLVHVSIFNAAYDPNSGTISRIVYSPGNTAPVAKAGASSVDGKPLRRVFTSAGTTDADGDTLSYRWDFGDGTTSTGANPTHDYAAGCYTATLTVSDGRGKSSAVSVSVSVGNEFPVPVIESPVEGTTYTDGQAIQLEGSATDREDGNVPASKLQWSIDLHHGTSHIHQIGSPTGASPSFTTQPGHDSDSWYEVTLRTTDSCGARAEAKRNYYPRTRRLEIRSSPEGAPIEWSGSTLNGTYAYDAAVGFQSTVSAPASFVRGSTTYVFSGWSDGGSATHGVTVPDADTTLEASYAATSTPPVISPPEPGAPEASPLQPSTTPTQAPVQQPKTKKPARKRDRTKPALARVTTALRATGSPVIRGVATDAGGIKRVEVLLAARPAGSTRCQFWSARTLALGKARSCRRPGWNTAKLTGRGARRGWSVRLWKRAVPGRWLMRVRVTDKAGNRFTVERPLPVTRG